MSNIVYSTLLKFFGAIFVGPAYEILGLKFAAAFYLAVVGVSLLFLATSRIVSLPLMAVYLASLAYGISPLIDIAYLHHISMIDEAIYFKTALPLIGLYLAGLTSGGLYKNAEFNSPHKKERRVILIKDSRSQITQHKTTSIFLFVLTSIYLYLSAAKYGLTIGDFSRSEIYQENNLLLQIVNGGVAIGIIVLFRHVVGPRRIYESSRRWTQSIWIYSILTMGYINIAILGDRRVFLGVCVALVLHSPRIYKNVYALIFFIASAIMMWLYSFVRNIPISDWLDIMQSVDAALIINPANGEFGGWTRIAQDILSSHYSQVFQPTILKAPLSLVPSAIYPDRPLAPSNWYVNSFDPNTAALGGGWAFALPIEAFMNLWYAGPLIFGAAIGAIVSIWSRDSIYSMIATFVFTFSFRSDLVSLLQVLCLSLFFLMVYKTISIKKKIFYV
jgi:hypothetical protein